MSHIFLQKDNITILWDTYSYSIKNHDREWVLLEEISQRAVMLQIILLVNWKQRLYRVKFDLEAYTRTAENESEAIWGCQLKNYNEWNNLREFLITIWYDISEMSITSEIEKAEQETGITIDTKTTGDYKIDFNNPPKWISISHT